MANPRTSAHRHPPRVLRQHQGQRYATTRYRWFLRKPYRFGVASHERHIQSEPVAPVRAEAAAPRNGRVSRRAELVHGEIVHMPSAAMNRMPQALRLSSVYERLGGLMSDYDREAV